MSAPNSPAPARPRTLPGRVAASARATRILTYVLVTVFAASIVVPVIWVLSASVKTKSEFYGTPWKLPEGFYFQNYLDAFFDAHLGEYFLNSVMVTAGAVAVVLVVSIPAAYGLSRFRFPGRSIVQTCLMAGLFINVNYIVVPIFLMLIGWDRSLMPVTQHAVFIDSRATLALVYAATTIPFTVYLLSNFMSTIPAHYEEAAMIDGASRLRTMIQVIIPMAKPAITTVILFDVLSYWNDFIIALTLVPGQHKTLQVGLLNLMTAQRAAANYGRLYAGMVRVMVPVLIFYALVQRRLIEGIAGGGAKG
jgi:N-acetylglucosamine transport system permease protein